MGCSFAGRGCFSKFVLDVGNNNNPNSDTSSVASATVGASAWQRFAMGCNFPAGGSNLLVEIE